MDTIVQKIEYEVRKTKQLGNEIHQIGSSIAKLGGSSLPDCSSQISSAWTSANKNAYLKKFDEVTDKVKWLGIKAQFLGNLVVSSADSILAADQIARSIITGATTAGIGGR